MKLIGLLKLTALPVLISSLCCLAPILLILFGISSLSFAISVTNILDGQYRWAFILSGLITLMILLILYFRRKGVCTLEQAVRRRNEIVNKIVLSVTVSGIVYVLFFYLILGYVGKVLHLWK